MIFYQVTVTKGPEVLFLHVRRLYPNLHQKDDYPFQSGGKMIDLDALVDGLELG